jgi:putative oxidoreductase
MGNKFQHCRAHKFITKIQAIRPEATAHSPIAYLLGATFPMHNFWAVSDPQMQQADMINFLKNTALVGALLMLLAIPQPWPFSLASR